MPSMQFQPVLREIRDVLGSDFYSIPRFQRPYSWTSENLEDFWRDVIIDNDEGYFIGPMVAYTIKKGQFGIVDGQQRLTSVMLALAALRDLFASMKDDAFADGMAKYIERADDDSHVHYVLQSLGAKEYFSSQFLVKPPRMKKAPKSEEQRSLSKAFIDISGWFLQQIDDLSMERGADDSPSEASLRLREFREKILSLKVIWIRLDEEDDAYVIFETLNSRGKDLEVIDLLKNLLFSHAKQENADLDTARSTWEEMRRILEEEGGRANPNKFILHWWLSQREYTAERKLFRLIKKKVQKPEAAALIPDLEKNARLYARIVNPYDWAIPPGSPGIEVKDSLKALGVFGVSQPRPMLLSLMRAWDNQDLKYSSLKRAVRIIENFHYVSTAIVGISSTGGISEMYAKHARELAAAYSDSSRAQTLSQLIKKLTTSTRLPSRESFLAEFPRTLRFSEHETSQKRLVQYTLRRLQDYERPGVAFDHAKCNIEHVSNQSDAEAWMPEIGNLLWIDSVVNTKLGSKKFAEKQGILSQYTHTYALDDILAAGSWGEPEVAKRSRRLAELALDKVWVLK